MISEYNKFIQPFSAENTTHGYDSKTKQLRPLRVPFRLLHYVYQIETIANEVYKRTSLIGKHRRTEQGVHLLDAYALTADDKPMFDSMCHEAAAAVYEKMLGFSPNENNSFLYNEDKNAVPLRVVTIHSWSIRPQTTTNYDNTTQTITKTYRWKMKGEPQQGDRFIFSLNYKYRVRNTFGETETRESKLFFDKPCADCERVGEFYSSEIPFLLDVDDSEPLLPSMQAESYINNSLSVDTSKCNFAVTFADQQNFVAGDWITYEGSHYVVQSECNDNEQLLTESGALNEQLFARVPNDFLGSVIFTIAKPKYVVENSLKLTDRAIFEALVNYIMYKWFVIAVPAEAEYYMSETAKRLRDIKTYMCAVARMPNTSHPF